MSEIYALRLCAADLRLARTSQAAVRVAAVGISETLSIQSAAADRAVASAKAANVVRVRRAAVDVC